MIRQIFSAVRVGQAKVHDLGAWLGLSYAVAICPADVKPILGRCLKEAEDFRLRLTDMIARNSDELEFIVMQSGCAEQQDVYPSYDALMDFFKNLDEDEAYPHTNYLSRTARAFIRHFDELPDNVANALNRSLKIQLTMIERIFRGIFQEAVLDALEPR